MLVQSTITILFSAFAILLYKYSDTLKKIKIPAVYFLFSALLIGFIYRVYLSPTTSFPTDIDLFTYWSNAAYDLGLFGLYDADFFLDYPPGYMYILYVIRAIAQLFSVDINSEIYVVMLKIPAILADLASAVFIYLIAKKYQNEYKALALSVLYILAPTVIFNSAVWGQIDSYYTLLVISAVYFAMKDDVKKAAIIYAIALATKPQSLLFGPVLLFYMIDKKDIKKLMSAFLYGFLTLYIVTIPISKGYDLLAVVDFYMNTFSGYKSMTVNAFNVYALFKLHWVPLEEVLYGGMINTIAIPLICLFAAYYFFTTKDKEKYLQTANIIIILIFSFCTMMHERYIFPALLISLLSAAVSGKIRYVVLFLILTASSYINIWHVYVMYNTGIYFNDAIVNISAVIFIIGVIYLLTFIEYKPLFKIKIKPMYYLLTLLIFTFVLTFFNLGSSDAPQTIYQSKEYGEQFVISFDEDVNINEVYYYMGMGDEHTDEKVPKVTSNFSLYYSDENGEWAHFASTDVSSVFSWRKAEIQPVYTNAVAVVANDKNQTLSELVFLDENGEIIPINLNIDAQEFSLHSPYNLFDESDIFTKDISYFTSSYFDEIYFARTAYEINEDYSIYETTHPHLGKYIISIGISLFGMNPFGFRIMGAIFGVLIVAAVYLLSKELLKSEKAGLIAAALSAFDCMRFTQSRIATSDSFLVLFMILTFYFMVKYRNLNVKEKLSKNFLYLGLSGLFMALTVSVKWNGAYPMIGLAVFFFYILYKKYTEHKDIKIVIKTVLFCFLAFVFIPIIIYFILFLPVLTGDGIVDLVLDFIRWQENMFNYHSQLVSEHFFASPWYTWFVVSKPIWLSVTREGDLVSSISSFGNIAIWWAMPIAVAYLIYKIIKNKDENAIFITISYIMCIVPWMAITRLTFIYHYFPATIFGILAISYILNKMMQNEKLKKYAYIYLAVVFVVFIIYLPVAGGFWINYNYADSIELFSTWYFN